MTEEPQVQDKSQQSVEPSSTEAPGFGWTPYAEQINGRFAMLGLLGLLLLEFFTHQDFYSWIGLR
ncbi:chlorophyll a/b-binding protein [Alkalinema sp. FACHB-956]|uniref:chlorophyll a/b-binding protein n=1 Tax=Alkalinema sp. FACHB-956 TaxID=2692768 RepID=UPI001682C2BF|nr:chlorophyll a/b-binding protein [Alkalinema sp. FACHB-956]MBD2327409.1 high light inducible protein [Alkalinema sp. FACHB-956]